LDLMRSAPVVDAHCDTIAKIGGSTGRRLGARLTDTHIDLPRLVEARVAAQFFACCIDPRQPTARPLERALEQIDTFYCEAEANPGTFAAVTGPAGVGEAFRQGRVAGLLAVEGGEVLQGSLAVLRMLHRLGVRYLTLTWNYRNALADGFEEARTGGGLSRFGVEVVREMGRLGMLVDVSHLSEAGFWQVMEVAEGPVIASHANARAVCDHPRNLTDDQIRALAQKGGVMGLCSCGAHVREGARPASDPQGPRATLDDLLDHADHIIAIAGPSCLGFGLDLDGTDNTTAGLDDVLGVPRLVQGLLERGHSPDTVRAAMGGNFLRVMEEVGMK